LPVFDSGGALGVAKVTSTRLTQAYTRLADNDLREGKARMNTISRLANLLHPANEGAAAVQVRQPLLLPRTAADELPPYREQPWIIDRRGYRKIDPSMTLVPMNRL
jgi:hypothetical protein